MQSKKENILFKYMYFKIWLHYNEDEYEFSAQRAANEFFSFLVQILLKTLNYKKTKSDVKLFKFFLLNFNFTNKNARKKIP